MATWAGDSTSEFGESVAQAKLDTQVRADFELQDFMRDWVLIVRPIMKTIQTHGEMMIQSGVMGEDEGYGWINRHWEYLGENVSDVADGICLASFSQTHETRCVIAVHRKTYKGYERIRIKMETFIRECAGEDEFGEEAEGADPEDEASEPPELEAPTDEHAPPGTNAAPPDDPHQDAPSTEGMEPEAEEAFGAAREWSEVESDPETYEAVTELWGLAKEQKQAAALAMAQDAADLLKPDDGEEGGEGTEEEEEEEAEAERESEAPEGLSGFELETLKMKGKAALAEKAGRKPDVWWEASKLGPDRGKTGVPRDLTLSVGGRKFRVHANATKHMEQHASTHSAKRPGHAGRKAAGVDFPISSLAGALGKGVKKFEAEPPGRIAFKTADWDLIVDTKDTPWCLFHAVYKSK